MATICTVTANPLLNYVTDHRLTSGAVNRIHTLTPTAEGKGINVARVLQALGHDVVCCGFAGGETGHIFRQCLDQAGLAHALTSTASPLRLGFMAESNNHAHPTTLLEDGFVVSTEECDRLVATIERIIPTADLVIISGSLPDRQPSQLYQRLLMAAAAHDAPCWIDSYGAGMDAALASPIPLALAKPNREELETCEGWDRVEELHISDGDQDLLVRKDDDQWRITPPEVQQINPIGSGDCYVAGLAHARLSGMSWKAQLRYAAAAGAANAARSDVAMIGPDGINALIGQVTVTHASA